MSPRNMNHDDAMMNKRIQDKNSHSVAFLGHSPDAENGAIVLHVRFGVESVAV